MLFRGLSLPLETLKYIVSVYSCNDGDSTCGGLLVKIIK
jgi:hypothetical protein